MKSSYHHYIIMLLIIKGSAEIHWNIQCVPLKTPTSNMSERDKTIRILWEAVAKEYGWLQYQYCVLLFANKNGAAIKYFDCQNLHLLFIGKTIKINANVIICLSSKNFTVSYLFMLKGSTYIFMLNCCLYFLQFFK